jgi:transcription-repair coupling factor (superfamily II helicase)
VSLDRLGTSGWEKRRAKVMKGLAETAQALIRAAGERQARAAPKLSPERAPYERLAARFPFEETPDQARAIRDALADLASGTPMNRLVIGDVGFGKTEVAMRAAAAAAFAGRQVAVLAPTTVLARQHFRSFQRRFEGLDVNVAHLSRLVTGVEAKRVKEGIADGSVRIVVGTQAILGKGVEFADLALAVIDEEQRLGLEDKEKLRALLGDGHLLTMTATPIPRTLQSALVGLQDLSVIATPPARRRPIRTLLSERDPAALRQALLRERRRGGQSFVVVPRVEDVEPVAGGLRDLLPGLSIRVAHGQLPAKEIDEVMVGFAEGEGDVLLATSIIESGLDVPRANTMVVLRPDLFGLAQLHQLRGRVGRGGAQAYCYLLTEAGAELSPATLKRLGTLQALDRLGAGMAVAAQDLDLRGGGELFGTASRAMCGSSASRSTRSCWRARSGPPAARRR